MQNPVTRSTGSMFKVNENENICATMVEKDKS